MVMFEPTKNRSKKTASHCLPNQIWVLCRGALQWLLSADGKKWIDFVEIEFYLKWKYWMTLHATWIELIEAKSESHCLPNHAFDPWETKTTLVNRFDAKILYNLSSCVDVFGEISHPGNQKQSCCNRYKDFFWAKNGTLSSHYEECFFEFTIFTQ